jgi:hypothetical protein
MIDRLEALFHPDARKKLGGRDQAAIPLRVSGSRRARLTNRMPGSASTRSTRRR